MVLRQRCASETFVSVILHSLTTFTCLQTQQYHPIYEIAFMENQSTGKSAISSSLEPGCHFPKVQILRSFEVLCRPMVMLVRVTDVTPCLLSPRATLRIQMGGKPGGE